MFMCVLNFIPLVLLHTYSTLFLIKTYKVSSCVFLTPANKNPLKKGKKIEKAVVRALKHRCIPKIGKV